jgi:hypothetical protein
MAEEMPEETWITLPPSFLPALGALLVVAGSCLLLWSEILVGLFAVILGLLAILLGLGFLAAGHFLGRAGVPSLLLFIAGLSSLILGLLALLRRDLVFDLVIYLGAVIAILAGLFLLFIGSLLSLQGWGRRVFLWGGTGILLAGISLALFPALVARLLIAAGGAVITGAGCGVLFLAFSRRRENQKYP